MKRIFRHVRRVVIALAIITLGCSPNSSVPPSPPVQSPTPQTASPAPTDNAPAGRGILAFGDATRVPLDGQGQSDLFLFGGKIIWSYAPWRSLTPPLVAGTGRIVEFSLEQGSTRTVYTAQRANAGVSVKASEAWLAWTETPDPFSQKEMRIYAMSRGATAGDAILVDDVGRHPDLAGLIHFAIDGSDLYWTLPVREGTTVRGQLLHRRLPDGATELIASTTPGSVIVTPSAFDGIVAWAVQRSDAAPMVVYRLKDGSVHELGIASTTPAVGRGFLAVARDTGNVASYAFGDGTITDLAVGAEPRAYGDYLSWGSTSRDPADPAERSPFFVARPLAHCVARFKPPEARPGDQSIPAVAGNRIAWLHYDTSGNALARALVIQDASLSC